MRRALLVPTASLKFVYSELGIFDRNGALLANLRGGIDRRHPSGFYHRSADRWDPSTRRFYYTIYENRNHTGVLDPGIGWGFSAVGSPESAADFCNYFTRFDYGGAFPDGNFRDFPQLGTTRDFLLIGTNRITFGGF